MSGGAPPSWRVRCASVVGPLIGGLAYVAVLLDLRWAPTRTAIDLRYASNFFDIQANAFLEGRLDVPSGSLGIEGFVVNGRTFMYFPPFPALLRLPVMAITREFDGRLTVASMALAWLVVALMATRLFWLIRSLLRSTPITRAETVAATIILAAMTGGTVLTYDASLPWVYHEVYVWAVATVMGALYWLLRTTLEPTLRSVGWLTACTAAAILTRTTGGMAVCGAIVLSATWRWWRRRRGLDWIDRQLVDPVSTAPPSRAIAPGRSMLLAAAVPLLLSVTLNLAKFDHPYLFPLDKQVWTSVNEHRRETLAANGGTITGLAYLPTTASTYFRPDGARITPWFPWVSLPADPPPVQGHGALFDQTYRTASVPASTPLLFLLALCSLGIAFLRRGTTRRLLLPPLLGACAVGGGVLLYGYIANRYTSEFVPALLVGGSIAFWAWVPPLLARGRWWRRATVAVLGVLTAWSILFHTMTGLTTAAVTARGPELREFISVQQRPTGDRFPRRRACSGRSTPSLTMRRPTRWSACPAAPASTTRPEIATNRGHWWTDRRSCSRSSSPAPSRPERSGWRGSSQRQGAT